LPSLWDARCWPESPRRIEKARGASREEIRGSAGVLLDGIIDQTKAVMQNLKYLLQDLKIGFEHIAIARICLTRFTQDYAAMNESERSFFPADRLPARTCIGVTGLAYDALIEIDPATTIAADGK
jgi:enamine deaminase RidA (YjgF/YER057c/UK114 family)